MGSMSLGHWIIILIIVLLVFGSSRIEHLGRSLGRAIRGFKEGMNEKDTTAREVGEGETTDQLTYSQKEMQVKDKEQSPKTGSRHQQS
ncbi:MAG: twin-arginine translocase TatA/TatE family subunit [Bdellovibrionaceae bacterium]|nr:twin-arginine translocase TatA/TatE family subunit [Pseudobdellovibrionaceae bacterium]MDW8190540.1 twin-arginine translocase TatA/TatE family subunit [Pseudobdellovibrionaceae bacterium]